MVFKRPNNRTAPGKMIPPPNVTETLYKAANKDKLDSTKVKPDETGE